MNTKQRLFCSYFCILGNAREAAAKAGFSNPAQAGDKLLAKPEINEEIKSLQQRDTRSAKATGGLLRLAFGSVADAVSLLDGRERSQQELEQMDLFQIAEIKRPKAGGMEIKFFDRLKARQLLCNQSSDNQNGALPFYEALEKSALSLGGENGGD